MRGPQQHTSSPFVLRVPNELYSHFTNGEMEEMSGSPCAWQSWDLHPDLDVSPVPGPSCLTFYCPYGYGAGMWGLRASGQVSEGSIPGWAVQLLLLLGSPV